MAEPCSRVWDFQEEQCPLREVQGTDSAWNKPFPCTSAADSPPQGRFTNTHGLPAIKSQHYSGELTHTPHSLSPAGNTSENPSPNTAEVKQKPPCSSKPCVRVLPPGSIWGGQLSFTPRQEAESVQSSTARKSVHTKAARQLFSSRNLAQIKHGINTWTPSQQHSCSPFPSCPPQTWKITLLM